VCPLFFAVELTHSLPFSPAFTRMVPGRRVQEESETLVVNPPWIGRTASQLCEGATGEQYRINFTINIRSQSFMFTRLQERLRYLSPPLYLMTNNWAPRRNLTLNGHQWLSMPVSFYLSNYNFQFQTCPYNIGGADTVCFLALSRIARVDPLSSSS